MRISALLLAGLVVLTLTGCQPDDPIVVPQPEPSSTPLFASEEEALAAAEEAYARYLAVTNAILQDGGLNPERLLDVATQSVLDDQVADYEDFHSKGWRSVGVSSVDSIGLQSYDASSLGQSIVTIYACVDVSQVDVLDANGVSVVSASRPSKTPYEVVFDLSDSADSELVLSATEVWTGDDFCAL